MRLKKFLICTGRTLIDDKFANVSETFQSVWARDRNSAKNKFEKIGIPTEKREIFKIKV